MADDKPAIVTKNIDMTEVPEAPVDKPLTEMEIKARGDSSRYNEGTAQKQLFQEELNTAENHNFIMKAIAEGRAKDITDEPKKNGEPCFIIGSGPSLDEAIPILHKWEGGIICSTSQALTLRKWGVIPDYIMCLDPFCFLDEIGTAEYWKDTKTKIIIHPGVDSEFVQSWPGEMLLYIENSGKRDSFYATTQKRQYSKRVFNADIPRTKGSGSRDTTQFELYIRTELTIFACSPPAQMFAAGVVGYGRMFLSGCDFGFPHNKARFTEWKFGENGEWVEHPHPFDAEEILPEENKAIISQNGIPTAKIHVYYKKNMLSAWRLSLQNVVSCDKGIITEMPYETPEKVVRCQGSAKIKHIPDDQIIKRSEQYLAKVGAFVINTSAGLSFVESSDPLVDLPIHMMNMMKQWRCENCGAAINAPGAQPINDPCPSCGKKLVRAFEVDTNKNMSRVYKLLNLA